MSLPCEWWAERHYFCVTTALLGRFNVSGREWWFERKLLKRQSPFRLHSILISTNRQIGIIVINSFPAATKELNCYSISAAA